MKELDIKNWFNNIESLEDYSNKNKPDFGRQKTKEKIQDYLHNINWESESNYHNMYRVNGKYNKGRTITLSKNGGS